MIRRVLLISVAVMLLCGSLLAQSDPHEPTQVNAVWKAQEIEFTYFSLDTAYSCDVIEARIKMLLRHVGAADDVEVTVPPCPGFDRPQSRHRVTARLSTLVPAMEGDTDIVRAVWSEVELGKWHPQSIDDSDCELLEHFQKYLLPAVEHEVIEGRTQCGASKHAIVGRLKLRVLKSVAEDPAAEKNEG